MRGLGLMPLTTTMEGDKVLRRVTGTDLLSGRRIRGYEIHMGLTLPTGRSAPAAGGDLQPVLRIHTPGSRDSWEDGWSLDNGRIRGVYVHGLLDSPGWRVEYLNGLRRAKGLAERNKAAPARGGRFHQYDRLADLFERVTDVPRIPRGDGAVTDRGGSGRRGLVIVNTGPGKGKTTAALGAALRAAGQGMRVMIIQFIKARETGEMAALGSVADIEFHQAGPGHDQRAAGTSVPTGKGPGPAWG